MSALLAVGIALGFLGVVVILASLSSRRPCSEAGVSAADQFARVVSLPRTHGDECPWPTAANPLLTPDAMRAAYQRSVFGEVPVERVLAQDAEPQPEVTA